MPFVDVRNGYKRATTAAVSQIFSALSIMSSAVSPKTTESTTSFTTIMHLIQTLGVPLGIIGVASMHVTHRLDAAAEAFLTFPIKEQMSLLLGAVE